MKFKKITPANSAVSIFFTTLILLGFSLSSCTKNNDVQVMNSAVNNSTPNPSKPVSNMEITTADAAKAQYITSDVINLSNVHDITISKKSIAGGNAPCITLYNCYNITIIGNKLHNSADVGVYLRQCHNIVITDNFIVKVSTGVYADHCHGGGIQVNGNQFLNMGGPMPRGQCVQFNNVDGANNAINSNICENISGESHPEDAISLYQSNGVAGSPITIYYNHIRGGGPSTTGGGIMLGDSGGSYETAYANKLVNPGQYGIAISGGGHNTVTNNYIYSKSQWFTNIGVYVQSIGSKVSSATVSCNRVLFYDKRGVENDKWLGPGTQRPSGWDSNILGATLSAAILPVRLITK
jgi:parallel beta-helix repeat protein